MVCIIFSNHDIRNNLYVTICIDNELSVKNLVIVCLIYATYIDHEMNNLYYILVCSECLYVVMSVSSYPYFSYCFSP